jgi:hypothetical protein
MLWNVLVKGTLMVRSFTLAMAVLAVALFLCVPMAVLAADEDTHEGKIVSASKDKLVMTGKDGKTEHTHTVAPDATITCNGKDCKLEDLKEGYSVKVTTKKGDKTVATKIEARTKDKNSK